MMIRALLNRIHALTNVLTGKPVRRSALLLVLLCICSMPGLAGAVPAVPTGPLDAFNGIPDYYTTANWANSPPLAKFVDTLPGLSSGKPNNLGQYLPVAVPDTTSYPGSDYYIIELREYFEKMHSDLNPTKLRGYVQVTGAGVPVAAIHYLGPIIVAERDRPVRIKFTNKLPTGSGGDLFIPVDTTVMGAGKGAAYSTGAPCDSSAEPNSCANYTQNRADIHLHGGRTPWISDGTPHQWVTPAGEITPFKKGVSMQNVPDMPDPGDGSTTYYFTNQQSARLMFYHDHAWGITRLNVYAGEAAGYVITDQWERDLISRNKIPPFLDQIPLILQDKTYVDDTPTTKYIYNTVTGLFDTPITVPKVRETDPLWNWGSAAPVNGVRPPVKGDLWLPHVYMPAQNSLAGSGGVNPFGRWMYGPWFYPATIVAHGPVANPYYDARCSSSNPFELAQCETPGQPPQIPGTPNVSMGMEAFQDSAVVNGTAFPSLTVDPRAYRFRILNAASDRFWNLSFYLADPGQISPDLRPASRLTEVKMVTASAELAEANNWPADWPVDGRDGGVPDPGLCQPGGVNCPNLGPGFLQIGTEGGFLPQPVQRNPQPVTYITDPTAFWVGVVDKTGLALGPAERADVIVDFSDYAGQTLILYNDAPAAWPARVPGYDYYTNAPDMRDSGGYGTGGTFNQITGAWEDGTGPVPGYAPNTRTVMQVIVRPAGSTADGTYTFDRAALEQEFTSAAPAVPGLNPAPAKTLFERAQEPIIVGQAAYSTAYPASYFPTNFPWEGINQINDHFLDFVTLAGEKVHVPTEPKGIHDEMGASFDLLYGRMSGNLAMQLPNPTTLDAVLVLYGFSDVPTEQVNNSTQVNVQVLPGLPGQAGTVNDGTQIWKISHNGVDTHPIHFHIFDVQLVNRVGWDGQIALPEANELGWKDTVKISPLMDTIVAVRPRTPALPFGIPNSLRPLNPAIPIDSQMGFGAPIPTGSDWPIPLNDGNTGSGFSSIDWQTGEAYVGTDVPPYPYPNYKEVVTNVLYNFGWEYVWHCHILSHEEMDMMRPIVLDYQAMLPPTFNAAATTSGSDVVLNWNDPTPVTYTNLGTYGNPANEIGFNVYRSTVSGSYPINPLTGKPTPLTPLFLRANSTGYTDTGAAGGGYNYIIEAFNAKGSTVSFAGNLFTVNVVTTAGTVLTSPGPVNLRANISGLPAGVSITRVEFYDGASLIGSDTTSPYTYSWSSVTVGTHSITAKAYHSILDGTVVSTPLDITMGGTLTADFTPADGAIYNVCDIIPFTSTSGGPVSGYSWLINGASYSTPLVNSTLPPGTYPITLAVTSASGETAQVTKNVTVVSRNPIANPGGPYTVIPGGSLLLSGSGTDPDTCEALSYAWNVDNKNGFDYFTANPGIPYSALFTALGVGIHTMTFQVTDSYGNIGTATTTVTLDVPNVRINSTFYPDLQTAYNGAGNNAVILLATGAATGGLVADKNISVTLAGGLDAGFSTVTGVTTINKPVTLKQGKVIMRNIRLLSPYPVFTTTSPLPGYTLGAGAYSATIAATGGITPYNFAVSAGTPPTGLTLAPSGLLSGTPTTAGTYTFTVTVTDSATPPVVTTTSFQLTILP